MTAEQFRRLALRLPETTESVHMNHPDFRVRGGKIFATLAYPDETWAMVKLTPEQVLNESDNTELRELFQEYKKQLEVEVQIQIPPK